MRVRGEIMQIQCTHRQTSQTICNSSDPNLNHSIIYKPNSLQSSSDSSICLLIGRLTRTVAVFVFITNGFS